MTPKTRLDCGSLPQTRRMITRRDILLRFRQLQSGLPGQEAYPFFD
jgi:hypothetical protein